MLLWLWWGVRVCVEVDVPAAKEPSKAGSQVGCCGLRKKPGSRKWGGGWRRSRDHSCCLGSACMPGRGTAPWVQCSRAHRMGPGLPDRAGQLLQGRCDVDPTSMGRWPGAPRQQGPCASYMGESVLDREAPPMLTARPGAAWRPLALVPALACGSSWLRLSLRLALPYGSSFPQPEGWPQGGCSRGTHSVCQGRRQQCL